jgi:hypothetical protein
VTKVHNGKCAVRICEMDECQLEGLLGGEVGVQLQTSL